MNIPILRKHHHDQIIGVLRTVGDQLIFEFISDVEITMESAYEIFGNAGIRVLEQTEKNGVKVIRKGQIVEFSLP